MSYNPEWSAANRDRLNAYNRQWKRDHPDRVRAYNAKERAANPEKVRERGTRYVKANRAKVAAQQARWRLANLARADGNVAKWQRGNREKLKEYRKEWERQNPDKMVAKWAARRARKVAAPGRGVTGNQWRQISVEALGLCAYCNNDCTPTLDHIEPLARGGEHDIDNAAAACGACNSSKGDTPLFLWLAKRASREGGSQ